MVPVAIKTEPDYYPFGGVIADRGFGRAVQPHKTAGKELDMMHGLGWADFGARRYDPVLPQWTQPDPMAEKYCHLSPYSYCGLNPANNIDPDGRKITYYIDDEEYEYCPKNGIWGFYADKKSILKGENAILDGLEGVRTANAIGEKMINDLVKSDRRIVINQVEGNDKSDGNSFDGSKDEGRIVVNWNPYSTMGAVGEDTNGSYITYRHENCALAHELGHAYDYIYLNSFEKVSLIMNNARVDSSEMVACIIENSLREVYGDPIRVSYGINEGSGKETISQKSILNYTYWNRIALYNIMKTK